VIQDVVQDLPLLPSPKVSSQSETNKTLRERVFWLAVWFLKYLPPNAVLELRISSTTIIIIILRRQQQQQQLHCILLCLFVVIGIVDFF
jgi:hypothetical protein